MADVFVTMSSVSLERTKLKDQLFIPHSTSVALLRQDAEGGGSLVCHKDPTLEDGLVYELKPPYSFPLNTGFMHKISTMHNSIPCYFAFPQKVQ